MGRAALLYSPDMPLSPAQKAEIKKILQGYQREVRGIVSKHKQAVISAVEGIDRKKTEKIKRLIEAS